MFHKDKRLQDPAHVDQVHAIGSGDCISCHADTGIAHQIANPATADKTGDLVEVAIRGGQVATSSRPSGPEARPEGAVNRPPIERDQGAPRAATVVQPFGTPTAMTMSAGL